MLNSAEISTSVVIPHHTKSGNLAVLRSVIDSVITQAQDSKVEVIVVCNPPSHTSSEIQSLYGDRVKVLSSNESNVSKARNLGLKTASGKNILFLDDDCVLESSKTLQKISEQFSEDPSLAAYGGDVKLPEGGGTWDRAYFEIQENWIHQGKMPSSHHRHLFGGFFAVRSELAKANPFKESVAFGGAELSLIHQLANGGHKIKWDDSLKVLHFSNLDFFGFIYRAYRQGKTAGRRAINQTGLNFIGRPGEAYSVSTLIYNLIFGLARHSSGPQKWKLNGYGKELKHFCISFAIKSKWMRVVIEARRLAKISY